MTNVSDLVRVKPLVWEIAPSHLDCDWADNIGLYQIARYQGLEHILFIGHDENGSVHATLAAAQSAAQADYAERILSALEVRAEQ